MVEPSLSCGLPTMRLEELSFAVQQATFHICPDYLSDAQDSEDTSPLRRWQTGGAAFLLLKSSSPCGGVHFHNGVVYHLATKPRCRCCPTGPSESQAPPRWEERVLLLRLRPRAEGKSSFFAWWRDGGPVAPWRRTEPKSECCETVLLCLSEDVALSTRRTAGESAATSSRLLK